VWAAASGLGMQASIAGYCMNRQRKSNVAGRKEYAQSHEKINKNQDILWSPQGR
jgi:hypothetical protein